jgi:cold shock CspA family protein
MENKIYNILWIDDEYDKLGALIRSAKDFGIHLIPYKSLAGGMSELEKNYPFYDGVLLDAKFFENEDDAAGSEDTYSSFRAKERIEQLPKKFKIFILTGQAEAFADKTFNKVFPKVFRKGIDKDEDALFDSLIKEADTQADTQIRHQYHRVFEVCTEKYIGEYAGQDLLAVLKEQDITNVDKYFNTIRKMVEDIFTAFNKFQLLPSEFVNPSVALNESSKFLMGKNTKGEFFSEKGYIHKEGTHLPKQIASNIWNILNATQDGSHRASIDEHVKSLRTPYLLNSIVFQLLDVIVWFKQYVDANPTTENWDTDEIDHEPQEGLIGGTIINYNSLKGFAFFAPVDGEDNIFIPPHILTDNRLEEGMFIKGESEEYTDNRTQELRKRIKRIELV